MPEVWKADQTVAEVLRQLGLLFEESARGESQAVQRGKLTGDGKEAFLKIAQSLGVSGLDPYTSSSKGRPLALPQENKDKYKNIGRKASEKIRHFLDQLKTSNG